MKQVRLVSAVIQLELVVDDGEVLHPLRVEPLIVAAADLPGWDVAAVVAEVQTKVDATE